MTKTGWSKVMKGMVGAGAIALVMVGQAAAAPLPGPLGFDQKAGFLSPADLENGGVTVTFSGATGAGFPASTFTDLSWGTGQTSNGNSKLNIKTFDNTTSPTNGSTANGDTNGNGLWESSEFWTITRLTQVNNVINEFAVPLWTIFARANFLVFADSARTSLIATDTDHDTKVEFNETINKTKAPTARTSNPHGTLCDDFYRVPLADLVTPVSIPLGDGDFLDLTFQIFSPRRSERHHHPAVWR